MRTFTCFTTDSRYTVPQLSILVVADEVRAKELARRQLLESPAHRAVEVHENGRFLFKADRAA